MHQVQMPRHLNLDLQTQCHTKKTTAANLCPLQEVWSGASLGHCLHSWKRCSTALGSWVSMFALLPVVVVAVEEKQRVSCGAVPLASGAAHAHQQRRFVDRRVVTAASRCIGVERASLRLSCQPSPAEAQSVAANPCACAQGRSFHCCSRS